MKRFYILSFLMMLMACKGKEETTQVAPVIEIKEVEEEVKPQVEETEPVVDEEPQVKEVASKSWDAKKIGRCVKGGLVGMVLPGAVSWAVIDLGLGIKTGAKKVVPVTTLALMGALLGCYMDL